jgi:putative transposase
MRGGNKSLSSPKPVTSGVSDKYLIPVGSLPALSTTASVIGCRLRHAYFNLRTTFIERQYFFVFVGPANCKECRVPRLPHQPNPLVPYHISARCINREWFLDIEDVWRIMENYLFILTHGFGVQIYSFVLMSNHFHLIAQFPNLNMSLAMQYFMRETSKSITKSSQRINQTYGSRYFKSCLTSHHYYLHAYKYVYRNPTESLICEKVEDYKYSTLSGLLGISKLIIPIEQDVVLFSDVEATLGWLNQSPPDDHKRSIQKALQKKEFQIPMERNCRKPHILEFEMY